MSVRWAASSCDHHCFWRLGLAGCGDHSARPLTSLERTLTLTSSSDDRVVSPTDKQIYATLSALDDKRDSWAILGRSEMTYLQVSGDKAVGFVMEYQEGDVTNHYRAVREDFPLEEVVQAFSEYRAGTINWAAYGDWDRITW